MDLTKVLVKTRKLPAQHVEVLWENIYRHNVTTESLSSILAFYMYHRIYPPPVQKAFDSLLIAFTGSKVSRKLRTLLFQTVEEMSHWLGPSCITETVRLSTTPTVVTQLLPCFLLNKDIPRPDIVVYEKLLSALTSPGLSQEDRSKVLWFLMNSVPTDLQPLLNKQLITWLSYSRASQTTTSLFRSADVTEVDGSPAMGLCTALSLVSSLTDLQVLSLVTFSNIRRYLYHSRDCIDNDLINAVFSYCSTLLTQASKKTNSHQDKQLISGVLEEILLVLRAVRDVDNSCKSRCQLMVGNIQLLADQLRLTGLLVSVWEYQLTQGDESLLTKKVVGSVVKSEWSQGPVSQRVAAVVSAYGSQLAPTLSLYAPNLLKLVATHPSVLVEEFLDIMPHLASDMDILVEVFHCVLDLPALSASICVHQTVLLVQAGFKVPVMLSVRQLVEAEHKPVYSHMMRSKAQPARTSALLKLYPSYWATVRPMLSLGLVEVCSQVAPLLLDSFLESVCNSEEANKRLFPTLLSRVPLLCPLPTYQKAVFDLLTQYVTKVCAVQPDLLEDSSVLQFLSVTSHTQLCPQLFESIVAAVGEQVKREEVIASLFETLDALLREMLMDKTIQNVKLETSVCTTLAKLASRHVTLIPRAITAFEKVGQTMQNSTEEETEALSQHIKELIRILKNPRVASVVLSPASKEDIALAALMRVLFQFLE